MTATECATRLHACTTVSTHMLLSQETRYRQRYLDLIVNPPIRSIFETRSRIVAGVRRYLDERGFLEVRCVLFKAKNRLQRSPKCTHASSCVQYKRALRWRRP